MNATVSELTFTDPELREHEWLDSTGCQFRWVGEIWCEWSDAGRGEWRPYGLTVYLTGPFTAVPRDDEIGLYADWWWEDWWEDWEDYGDED
ncbi:hypothetical protein [Mycobacterium sp. SMC-4]|uniref:hypothetical protein n=1 Tax=Mycobacterium sp. SMC-4 TaxID=2857059 RepID=UPI0021B3BA4A|nr:hypothetical protein [Mycobacterium sp. SMC-4]UXA19524.1 hypothetical protein KXD98_07965 [Mycobacterium sp. SMC-4]